MRKIFLKYTIILLLVMVASPGIHSQSKVKITAYVILNTECPISQNAVQIINYLKVKYPAVSFISVFSKWDSKKQIKLFRKKYSLLTMIIHDQKHKLITHLSATKTPEVFLINGSKKIIYKGAINNQYIAIGTRKETGIINYLEEAVKDYLLNGFVSISETQAVGCEIELLNKYDKSRY